MRLASHGLFLSSISAYLPIFYCWLCLNKTCLKSSYLHSDRQIQRRKLLGYVGGSLKRSDPQQTREGFFITITRCKITCNMQRSSQAANQHFLLHGIYSSITRVYMACQAIYTSGFDLTKKIIKYPPPSNLRLILPFPPQLAASAFSFREVFLLHIFKITTLIALGILLLCDAIVDRPTCKFYRPTSIMEIDRILFHSISRY